MASSSVAVRHASDPDIPNTELVGRDKISGDIFINIEQGLADICIRQFERRPIHRIHGLLRQVNERAYEPEIVAIGPYHRAKESTKMMEEHKHRYLKNLINSKPLQDYRAAMSELENEAREYYVEPIGLNDKEKFVDMMILDGCFIIELLRKSNMTELREKDDMIFKFDWMLSSLQRDLLLLENQMPFKVLCRLFDLIEAPNQHSRLAYLVCCFFKNLFPGMTIDEEEDKVETTTKDVGHLLGLIHSRWHLKGSQQNDAKVRSRNIKRERKFVCASTLKEAGVVFKKGEDNPSLFAIEFQKGKLRIPQLIFEDRTETIFRNFIAYEQYSKKPHERYVTDYINFLGRLIGSEKDVDLLCEYSIIDNWMGDTKAISDIFRKINECITVESLESSRYSMVFEKLNTHCNKRGNRWKAKMWSNYCNPWGITSICAASLIICLSIAQLVFAILKYYKTN
nr:UPF0481 protein At3g47200-like [Ipomoea trifida]